MVEHDGQVGRLLKRLDDLGIAEHHVILHRQRRRGVQLARRHNRFRGENYELGR
jgi:hypothetical protein